MLCSNCGKDNRDGSKFCQSCGTPLQEQSQPQERKKKSTSEIASGATCGSCGTLNAPGMKFCKMCGASLESAQGSKPAKVPCPSCGGETPSGYKFCQHCGTPLSATPPPTAASASGSQPAAAPAPAPAAAAPVAASPSMAPPASAGAQAVDVPKTIIPTGAPGGPPPQAVSSSATGEPLMAKTIIDMEGGPPVSPTPPVAQPAPEQPAPEQPAPEQPAPEQPAPAATPRQAAVSGAIQPESTTPAAQGVVTPETGKGGDKATLGPGAKKVTADEVVQHAKSPLARLVSVNRDGSDGEVHSILEESVDLGRTHGQLRFGDDPYLSDRHCRFYIKNGNWIVQDLESTNGVYVRLKASQDLEHQDLLLLGKQVIHFEQVSDPERDLSPAVEHGVLIFGSPLRTPWCRIRQLTVAGVARDIYHLYRSKVVIGREDGDILFPDDEFMSRRHLQLSMSAGKATGEDLGSSNGTYLRIRGQHQLDEADMIRIGDQLLRFEKA